MKNSNDCITSENIDLFIQEFETERCKSALREAAEKGAKMALEEINTSQILYSHVVTAN